MQLTAVHKSWLKRAVAMVLALYLAFAAFIVWAMRQPPETFGRVMSHMPDAVFMILPFETFWLRARAGHLQPGDPAPDFSLMTLDKSSRVQLSALTAERPVVLVFGSYT